MTPWLIIGSAACVWDDLAQWGDRPARVIAVNRMIGAYKGKLWAGATLHPELAAEFRASRPGKWPLFAPEAAPGVTRTHPKRDQWNGTSVLYAVRIALAQGAERVVVAGAPLDDGPHFYDSPSLRRYLAQYRMGWSRYADELDGRVRSLSGWTRELLGHPFEGDWLNA
ncbi:hypothetical protein E6C67_08415 [Azospirillum sp. TSA2s]|uniref:hypothetical protein n=1 Tax=Azospirillum sp. TSA2s TaxID=709810 RepID=UPI0010AA371E|nr:hypothetical protein [Azospirillum sp. TSA2s]QCG93962.1 hypothetical protein E6C67_08415 [Azospirillum sp. TSA2s]